VPTQHLQQALADILAPKSQDAITENFRIHGYLVDGYRGLSYTDTDGREENPTIRLLSERAEDNVYHAINQVIVRAGDHQRRFDIVLYVNGMPLAVLELKRPAPRTPTSPLRTRSSRPTSENCRWRSGSAWSRWRVTASSRSTARPSPRSTTTPRGTSTTTEGPLTARRHPRR
jgi:hypothetical protein